MRPIALLLLLSINWLIVVGYIDWCEYWVRMGKKESRPECAGYQLPKKAQLSPERTRGALKGLPQCDTTETLGCAECEARCDREAVRCGKKACTRRTCICRGDLFRDILGNCVPQCPNKGIGILTSVQKIVPVLLKNMWRSVFKAFRTTTQTSNSSNSTLF